jgi:exo-beta-1,3-glucanase (GH17 family)
MANQERQTHFFDRRLSRRELLFKFLPLTGFGVGLAYVSCGGSGEPQVVKPTVTPVRTPTETPTATVVPSPTPTVESRIYLPVSIKGLCYSPYRDGQDPDTGPHPTESEIKEDLDILEAITDYIRTYGAQNNLENIPRFVLEKGLAIKVNAGCYLGNNPEVNEQQIKNLVFVAKNYSNVVSVNVGNETQHFNVLSEDQLIDYIKRVREQIPPTITVTTGETWYVWTQRSRLADTVDYIFANCHPYWESIPIEGAVTQVKNVFERLQTQYPGKKIVIGETGWPSEGVPKGGVIPSLANQKKFIEEFLRWASETEADFYLFEAFDENWKSKYESDVGSHWGIYYSNRNPKHPKLTLK